MGLDLTNLRGECYDGAGNMCGPVKGAACRITEQYPQAMYLHCLNLVVVSSLKNLAIQNMMGVVDGTAVF